jgi:[NiFe] hydrogenase assembly HybE family chaperone
MHDTLERKVALLETVFRRIQATRMEGVPLLHPDLHVQAIGFAPEPKAPVAMGVLVTPWFMNLLRFPLGDAPDASLEGKLQWDGHHLSFIAAFEAEFGAFAICSLASPMFEYVDQDAAVATAREVLAQLRSPRVATQTPDPQRRRFLLGRGAVQPAERSTARMKGSA